MDDLSIVDIRPFSHVNGLKKKRGAYADMVQFLAILVGSAIVIMVFHSDLLAAAKRKSVPAKPPELKIVSVVISPEPYVPGDGALDFSVEVELPKDLDGSSLLEVSSLISSPSKRSMRFLASRQPVQPETSAAYQPGKSRMTITLTWDGTDQTKQLVESGHYTYEVRAKLLAVGENGPRTQMNSWPKRGTVIVK